MADQLDMDLVNNLVDDQGNPADPDTILEKLQSLGINQVIVDGESFTLEEARSKVAAPDILNYMNKGVSVDKSMMQRNEAGNPTMLSKGNAVVEGVSAGMVGLLGLPVDLLNSAQRGVETLGRRGINKVFGTEFSTKPEDMLFSSEVPPLGKESIATGIEFVGDVVGLDIDYKLDTSEVPKELRPWFVGGEIVGENAPLIVALPIAALTKSGSGKKVHAFWDEIIKNPKKFVLTETGATTFGASAVAAAEANEVENPYYRMGIEFLASIVGGNVVNAKPKDVKNSLARFAAKAPIINSVLKNLDPVAKQGAFENIKTTLSTFERNLLKEADDLEIEAASASGDQVQVLMQQAAAKRADAGNFNLDFVFSTLEEQYKGLEKMEGVVGLEVFAGNLANNPALTGLQNYFAKNNDIFSTDTVKNINSTLSGILATSQALAKVGNIEAARALENTAYQQAINMTLFDAEARAQKLFRDAGKNTSVPLSNETKARVSTEARDILQSAYDNWRSMEGALWGSFDQNMQVTNTALKDTINSLYNGPQSKLFVEQTITGNAALNQVIDRLRNNDTNSLKDLQLLRSQMLEIARNMDKGPLGTSEFRPKSVALDIASAALKDIDVDQNSLDPETLANFNFARKFSSELHTRFSVHFPSAVLGKEGGAGGVPSMRANQVLENATSGTGQDAANNLEEMQVAADRTDQRAVEVTKRLNTQAAAKAGVDNEPIITPAPPTTSVATNDGVIYPENTAYPYRATRTKQQGPDGEGFTMPDYGGEGVEPSFRDPKSGNDIFPPDGRRSDSMEFSDDVVDENGNPIPSSEMPDGVSAQETLDSMFGRPEGSTYSKPVKQQSPEEFEDGVTSFYDEDGADFLSGDPEGDVRPETVNPLVETDIVGGGPLGPQMSEAQESFLRATLYSNFMADSPSIKDPKTGIATSFRKVDPAKVRAWQDANSQTLQRFPKLEADLAEVIKVRIEADQLHSELARFSEGNLTKAISEALNSPAKNVSVSYKQLADIAKQTMSKDGGDAIVDLRNATFEGVFRNSKDPSNKYNVELAGSPNFTATAVELLTSKTGQPDGPTLLDIMVDNQIITPQESAAIVELLVEGIKIEKNFLDPTTFDDVIKPTSNIVTNVARIAGANVGAALGDGGASLQTAQIISGQFKKYVSTLPKQKQEKASMDLLKSPKTLVAMYSQNPKVRENKIKAFGEYLVSRYSEGGVSGIATDITKRATIGTANVLMDGLMNTPVSAKLGAFTGEKSLPEDAEVSLQMEQLLSQTEEERIEAQMKPAFEKFGGPMLDSVDAQTQEAFGPQ